MLSYPPLLARHIAALFPDQKQGLVAEVLHIDQRRLSGLLCGTERPSPIVVRGILTALLAAGLSDADGVELQEAARADRMAVADARRRQTAAGVVRGVVSVTDGVMVSILLPDGCTLYAGQAVTVSA